ncbi:lipoprotein [Flavobacterium sp. XGLA_31]
MRKPFYVALFLIFLTSCASHPGRVCGGPGGKRCVDTAKPSVSQTKAT